MYQVEFLIISHHVTPNVTCHVSSRARSPQLAHRQRLPLHTAGCVHARLSLSLPIPTAATAGPNTPPPPSCFWVWVRGYCPFFSFGAHRTPLHLPFFNFGPRGFVPYLTGPHQLLLLYRRDLVHLSWIILFLYWWNWERCGQFFSYFFLQDLQFAYSGVYWLKYIHCLHKWVVQCLAVLKHLPQTITSSNILQL